MTLLGIPLDDKDFLNKLRDDLSAVYNQIPDTKGCMNNIHAEGGCAAWCCETQNPQVLYSEFINTWRFVNEQWDQESVTQLIAGAIKNFLNNSVVKGCIFWDKKSKLCTQHESRPMNCRIYGITPPEEFEPRYQRLKVLYPKEDIRPQCSLVSTIDDKQITPDDTERYWKALKAVETGIGVPDKQITDAPGGTYRTFHDHIMMSLYPKQVLVELTKMRLHATQEEKERFVSTVVSLLRQKYIDDAKQQAQDEAVATAIQDDHRKHDESEWAKHSQIEETQGQDTEEAQSDSEGQNGGASGAEVEQGSNGPQDKGPDNQSDI